MIPLDRNGAPDLQLLIQQCGDYQHVDWHAWDEAVAHWHDQRRLNLIHTANPELPQPEDRVHRASDEHHTTKQGQ
jgi:hypothetical protein